MKISELITSLEKLKEEKGDLEVVVHYRDGDGYIPGFDTNAEPFYDDEDEERIVI